MTLNMMLITDPIYYVYPLPLLNILNRFAQATSNFLGMSFITTYVDINM
jgi:hypothetical protein